MQKKKRKKLMWNSVCSVYILVVIEVNQDSNGSGFSMTL